MPAGFPSAVIPFESPSEFVAMLPAAIVISIVSYVGSISLALVFAKARNAPPCVVSLGEPGLRCSPPGGVRCVSRVLSGAPSAAAWPRA